MEILFKNYVIGTVKVLTIFLRCENKIDASVTACSATSISTTLEKITKYQCGNANNTVIEKINHNCSDLVEIMKQKIPG